MIQESPRNQDLKMCRDRSSLMTCSLSRPVNSSDAKDFCGCRLHGLLISRVMYPVTVPRKSRCFGLMLKMIVSESKLILLASLGKIVKKEGKENTQGGCIERNFVNMELDQFNLGFSLGIDSEDFQSLFQSGVI